MQQRLEKISGLFFLLTGKDITGKLRTTFAILFRNDAD